MSSVNVNLHPLGIRAFCCLVWTAMKKRSVNGGKGKFHPKKEGARRACGAREDHAPRGRAGPGRGLVFANRAYASSELGC
jgi:hypothetical protein